MENITPVLVLKPKLYVCLMISIPCHLTFQQLPILDSAYLYGAEYQFTYKNVAIVPCAICKATIMVPAKLTCPQNWTLQYHGYLGAGHYADQASEFICIDSDAEYFEGLRQHNNNGLLIYPVQTRC